MNINKAHEIKKIAMSFVVLTAVFKIIFFNETAANVLKSVASLYWLLILPGIGLTYIFRDIPIMERLAASIAIGSAIIGISAYYFGIAGIHVKYSLILLPALFILVSAIVIVSKSKEIDNNAP